MRIRMTCTRRGKFGVYPIGQTVEAPDDLAETFLKQKAAVRLTDAAPAQQPPGDDAADTATDDAPAAPAEPTFDDIGLGGRIAATLKRADPPIETVGRLRALVKAGADLEAIDGIGAATAVTIRAAISQ